MGNMLTPRKVSVTTSLTLLTNYQKRSRCFILNAGAADVGITSDATETAFGDCYPIQPGQEHASTAQNALYAIASAGTVDVWVWEEEN